MDYRIIVDENGIDVFTPWGIGKVLQDSDRVMSGKQAFSLVDSEGLPFDILRDICKDREIVIDMIGLMVQALKSGWKEKTLRRRLVLEGGINEDLFGVCLRYIEIKKLLQSESFSFMVVVM